MVMVYDIYLNVYMIPPVLYQKITLGYVVYLYISTIYIYIYIIDSII